MPDQREPLTPEVVKAWVGEAADSVALGYKAWRGELTAEQMEGHLRHRAAYAACDLTQRIIAALRDDVPDSPALDDFDVPSVANGEACIQPDRATVAGEPEAAPAADGD